MNVVEVRKLRKEFGNVVAVDDLSFDIREGEIYGILGPNGAGKTTTLKMLMGLLDPDSGTAEVFRTNPVDNPIRVKEQVGYVPEEQLLYESLTPKELFEFVASIRGLDPEKTETRLAKIMDALEFREYYNSLIVTLSSGSRQKVLIITALLHAPKLLILDEPFSGLDVRTTRILKDVVEIHSESGGSVLFSTHIMEMAQALCDRVGIIDRGTMIAEGTIEELRTQAKEEGATLEQLFLRLTEQEDEVTRGVDSLREALAE
ncbi:ABC transporter ATP-binding protein [Candidatus Thorarchaeota archaeon]|nr:MAG: ABC transporter ATP-binding protein [Candidatus Thorarchaeota archaeon]